MFQWDQTISELLPKPESSNASRTSSPPRARWKLLIIALELLLVIVLSLRSPFKFVSKPGPVSPKLACRLTECLISEGCQKHRFSCSYSILLYAKLIGCPDSSTETKQGAQCKLQKCVKWIFKFYPPPRPPPNADVLLNTFNYCSSP